MTTQSEISAPLRPRRIWQWADVRRRNLGMYAYLLNRITGIGLVVYLYLHLGVLSMLTRGPSAWDPFIEIAKSPAFLTLDVILLVGMLIHGLNGIRITLNGFGVAVSAQKALFVGLMALAALSAVVGAFLIFTK
jgi:succinate dehydrogenase / fumarate reductase cytochrome b subunit